VCVREYECEGICESMSMGVREYACECVCESMGVSVRVRV